MSTAIRKSFDPIKEFDSSWLSSKINEDGINYLENLGYFLCDVQKGKRGDEFAGRDAITTSQIRNIFSEAKRLESLIAGDETKWTQYSTEVLLIRPKIAYNTARAEKMRRTTRMKQFRAIMELSLAQVNSAETYRRFVQFFEGIVAYHKVYGGRD